MVLAGIRFALFSGESPSGRTGENYGGWQKRTAHNWGCGYPAAGVRPPPCGPPCGLQTGKRQRETTKKANRFLKILKFSVSSKPPIRDTPSVRVSTSASVLLTKLRTDLLLYSVSSIQLHLELYTSYLLTLLYSTILSTHLTCLTPLSYLLVLFVNPPTTVP